MIIADQRTNEPDLLAGVINQPLSIKDLDGGLIVELSAPDSGWQLDALRKVDRNIRAYIGGHAAEGFEIFVGPQWVGGSEV